ncbi:MAG: PAS domain S-box-containing protein [Natronomonas sp.]|jgi:PAS domain S-box-containing protein
MHINEHGAETELFPVDEPEGLRHLVGHIQDAVVAFELVDDEPVIRSVNESFVELFGYDREDVVDTPLNDHIVPEWLADEADTLDSRTASGAINYRRVQRRTTDGLREFLYRGIPYPSESSRLDGFAVYTDLTEINRKERQLQVVTRVLRHNLRTEANTIEGNAAQLLDSLDGENEAAIRTATVIEGRADRLLGLAGDAAEIDDVLQSPRSDAAPLDCVPLVRAAVEQFRNEYPDATVDIDLPDSMTVSAIPRLQLAIENVVENAIEHNPADEPTVRVRIEGSENGRWADIIVDDDAPPIPPVERNVVTGDADVTPKHHGSGLGLWLVKWIVDRSGGELAFEDSDLGGNSVRIRLQRE